MNDAYSSDTHRDAPPQTTPPLGAALLKPKGACWYCNQPVDNVRKFCNKTCADDYRTEEEAFNDAGE